MSEAVELDHRHRILVVADEASNLQVVSAVLRVQ